MVKFANDFDEIVYNREVNDQTILTPDKLTKHYGMRPELARKSIISRTVKANSNRDTRRADLLLRKF